MDKLAPWKTSYESSCLYFSPTELEDNSGWWNTLQSEHQACCTHSQLARYYRTHNYSQPLSLPHRQLDWRLLTGLLYSGRLLSLGAKKCIYGSGSTCSSHTRTQYGETWPEDGRKSADVRKSAITFVQCSSYTIAAATLQLKYATWGEIQRQCDCTNYGTNTRLLDYADM